MKTQAGRARRLASKVEEAHLAFDIAAPVTVEFADYVGQERQHLAAVEAETVKGAAFYERFSRLAVEGTAVDAL